MRRITCVLFLVPVLVAACGGAAAPTAAPGQFTVAPGQPTTPPAQITAAPAGGGTTVSVTLTGGAHAGSYAGNTDPRCNSGIMGAGMWGTQYSVFEGVAPGQLSRIQLSYNPNGASLKLIVGIGPFFDTGNGYTEYDITSNYEGQPDSGTGTVQVNDAGLTAVIHVTGTTEDGVGVDVTINCPTIAR